jgi:signal transduction histidine kinase
MLDYTDAPASSAAGRRPTGMESTSPLPELLLTDPGAGHGHDVQFYIDEAFLTSAVADYLLPALLAGLPVLVIATPAHHEDIRARLIEAGAEERLPLVTSLDAQDTLDLFMVGDSADLDRFRVVVGDALRLSGSGLGVPARAFGEMVDLLCRQGRVSAALAIEAVWTELSSSLGFSLLCGYGAESFRTAEDENVFTEVCRLHRHAAPTEEYLLLDEHARSREIAVLQQRAHALAGEVSYRRRLERELRQALAERDLSLERERLARAEAESANKTKGEFLAVMSHELRTPLNAIAGYAELLEVGVHGTLSEPQLETLARIQRSQRHLLTLINEVLSYARTESGQLHYEMGPVAVSSLLMSAEEVVQPQMQAKRLAYAGCSQCDGLMVLADAEKVQQILINLLANATKYTEAGGSVWVQCEALSGEVAVHVHDTGIGVPAEKLETIFEPFVQLDSHLTRQQGGIGLGLAISRTLAQGMGGDLQVRSRPGRGSTFTLLLPQAVQS